MFLQDGRLELDNNRSERSIKPFVIGRKNWLFSNTHRGAKATATIYSIIETAKENGLNPLAYLTWLFDAFAAPAFGHAKVITAANPSVGKNLRKVGLAAHFQFLHHRFEVHPTALPLEI